MVEIDYIEIILLLLPMITAVLIGIWDYITTVYGVAYGGGYELNPAARELLERGSLEELMYVKGMHILLNIIVYIAGLVLYFGGKVKEVPVVKYSGMFLLILFFISYFVGLIVITLNILGLANTIVAIGS